MIAAVGLPELVPGVSRAEQAHPLNGLCLDKHTMHFIASAVLVALILPIVTCSSCLDESGARLICTGLDTWALCTFVPSRFV